MKTWHPCRCITVFYFAFRQEVAMSLSAPISVPLLHKSLFGLRIYVGPNGHFRSICLVLVTRPYSWCRNGFTSVVFYLFVLSTSAPVLCVTFKRCPVIVTLFCAYILYYSLVGFLFFSLFQHRYAVLKHCVVILMLQIEV